MADEAETSLKGRVALVTGATGGIGLRIATRLLQHGSSVLAVGRRIERLEPLRQEWGEAFRPLAADLSHADACERIVAALTGRFAQVDILVNNAGHDSGGAVPFAESDGEKWESVLEVNLTALMRLTRRVLPAMLARGSGDVVNLTSITTRRIAPGLAAYSATKHAIHGFSEVLRAECGPKGVRVIELSPGVVKTGFASARFAGDEGKADEYYGRFSDHLDPDDVARAALFALRQPPGVTIAEILLLPTRGG
ncbi:MAG: SDR family oxidoreductase [Reyranellaceae bacterium]